MISKSAARGTPAGSAAHVPSVACEAALKRINLTLAQHRRAQATLAATNPISGRLSVLPAGTTSTLIRTEGTLVRILSVAEAFCFGQLASRMEAQAPPPRSKLVDTLYLDAEQRATSSWNAAQGAFNQWANVNLHDQKNTWQEFLSITEARNAIIHGLGNFTGRQRRAANFSDHRTRLATLGYVVTTRSVRVTSPALDASAATTREVLNWVDGKLATIP